MDRYRAVQLKSPDREDTKMEKTAMFFILLTISSASGEIHQDGDTDDDYGGHSSEFKPMGYEWRLENLEYTPQRLRQMHALQKRTANLSPDQPAKQLLKGPGDYKFFEALPDVMKRFEKHLNNILKKSQLNGVITGRIKSMSSLLRKMEKDGVTDYRKITDIVGLRVTLQTTNDILTFKQAFQNSFDKQIKEIRCYGTCGPAVEVSDPREKKYWPWRGSGYRRLHFKVAIPKLKTAGEIQVGTPYMTIWADWSHEVVYKGPEHLKNNKKVEAYSMELAEYYTTLDNLRNGMVPSCPRILKETKGSKIFSLDDWQRLGSPKDACNSWNDLRINMP